MTMGVPSQDSDVKCLLGDRMVMIPPSVVMNNFNSLAVMSVAFSKQTLHISMHASAYPAYIVSSPEARNYFFLSRASRERGLGDGACV